MPNPTPSDTPSTPDERSARFLADHEQRTKKVDEAIAAVGSDTPSTEQERCPTCDELKDNPGIVRTQDSPSGRHWDRVCPNPFHTEAQPIEQLLEEQTKLAEIRARSLDDHERQIEERWLPAEQRVEQLVEALERAERSAEANAAATDAAIEQACEASKQMLPPYDVARLARRAANVARRSVLFSSPPTDRSES